VRQRNASTLRTWQRHSKWRDLRRPPTRRLCPDTVRLSEAIKHYWVGWHAHRHCCDRANARKLACRQGNTAKGERPCSCQPTHYEGSRDPWRAYRGH